MSIARFIAAGLAAALALTGCRDGDGGGGSGPSGNHRPVADAGYDRAVAVGRAVVLDASASSDADGEGLEYAWNLVPPPGSQAQLVVSWGAETSFVPDVAGTYLVALVVFDGTHESEPAVVVVSAVMPGTPGLPPSELVAWAGPNALAPVRTQVILDGSGSSDPYGRPLSFAWTLESTPVGSVAALADATRARARFTPDLEGEYRARLTVTDLDGATATDTVVVFVENPVPSASPGGDRDVYLGEAVALDAGATDLDGEPITYAWELAGKPAGSAAALEGADTATPTLTPDLPGWYVVSLTVSDAGGAAPAVALTVRAHPPLARLAHRALAAEYVPAIDRIVLIDDAPRALYVYDPVARTEVRVLLPLLPLSVGVAPDGRHAVVGHENYVSYVDLAGPTVVRTIPVPATVARQVVLAGNGYAYTFGSSWDSGGAVRAIDVESGAVTRSGGSLAYSPAAARLHPDGQTMYVADSGVSPSDIYRVDIGAGATVTGRDSPYHGDYAMCSGLWLSEPGDRIFTACGNTFRPDLTWAGRLDGTVAVRHLDHSAEARQVLVIPGSLYGGTGLEDGVVRVLEDGYLTQTTFIELSPFILPAGTFPSHGRWVFHSADGTRRWAIVQADAASAALLDFAILEL